MNNSLKNPNVIFCLPEGLTLGGVTTWSVELSKELRKVGFSTALGIHPSRYNNPALDFGIDEQEKIIDCMHLLHPDDPGLNAQDYIPYYQKALPGVLIPSWSWGTYAMTALLASQQPETLRVIGMAHSDESGYYQWLVHYEAMIHKFIVANYEILRKLSRMIPHRVDDIIVRPCPVHVPEEVTRPYSPAGKPLQLVYGGRIAQYQKRVFELIHLAQALADEGVNFNFRVIGGGADRERFYERVNKLPEKVRSMISLEDSVPLSELPAVWRSTDINILVSDFEGVSNSMLMGMAEGCVPVMTDVSGTKEVIVSGENGYLVKVGDIDAMVKIIKKLDQDRSQLAVLGKKANERVKASYSMKAYVPCFMQAVEEAWKMPPRPWPPAQKPAPFEAIHQEFTRLEELSVQSPGRGRTDRKKKILFVSHDSCWGGAPKVLYSVIKGLDREKWLPVVVLPDHGGLEKMFEDLGVKTVIAPMQYITTDAKKHWQQYVYFSNGLRERVKAMLDIIDREMADVVVTNTICIFEAALAAKLAGIPHIWYVHELCSQDDLLTPVLDYPAFYAAMDALSEKIVVISKAVHKEISQFFPSKKLELLYTGLEANSISTTGNKKKILGIDPKNPVVTFLGMISERKGALGLAETARLVARKFPQVKFVIAGKTEGPVYAKLLQLIQEKKVEDNFKFLGFRNDVHDVVACSDVIIIPSLSEPFSLVALEAMQASKPVVATRSGGPEEIVLDGETGILVPVNHAGEMAGALIRLLEDPALMHSMGQKGRQRFSDFSYDEYIRRFSGLLEGVTADSGAARPDHKDHVENMINLLTEAAQIKNQLATLNQQEDPVHAVRELLDYPDASICTIKPVSAPGRRPKISVCVPVYNGSQYLRECIDSILSQSFQDFELILVNDASTDASKQIIQAYQDPRVKYYENEQNLGLIGNWNRCLELSTGEYVCVFHQDDVMLPDNLGYKVNLLDQNPHTGFVFSDTEIIDQSGKTRQDHWFNLLDPNVDFKRSGVSFFDLMFANLNVICCPSVVARRVCYETLGGFEQRLPFSVDMEMWMRIALFYDVAYLSQPFLQYRFHESNLTHRYIHLDLIHIYLCKKILLEKYPERFSAFHDHFLLDDTTKRVFERAVHHYRQQEYRTAKQYLEFLKMIRGRREGSYMDLSVDQLLKYVNQANAMKWLGVKRREVIAAPVMSAGPVPPRAPSLPEKPSVISVIKPYIPQVIKKPLKAIWGKIVGQGRR